MKDQDINYWSVPLVVFFGCAIATNAIAQTTNQSAAVDRASSDTLDMLIVTARRVSEDISRVPISITAFGPAQLRSAQSQLNPTCRVQCQA